MTHERIIQKRHFIEDRYVPELMLAVTLTAQLNLLCLMKELKKIPGMNLEMFDVSMDAMDASESRHNRGISEMGEKECRK